MSQVACVTCFNNKHYVIMSWQWLCFLTITLDFSLEARSTSKLLFGLSAYHKWGLLSVLGTTIQYLIAPWKQRCALEMCISSTMFRIWKLVEGSSWWHGSMLDCELMGPGFDSCSRLTYSRYYVEKLFHPMHKCHSPHFFIFSYVYEHIVHYISHQNIHFQALTVLKYKIQ